MTSVVMLGLTFEQIVLDSMEKIEEKDANINKKKEPNDEISEIINKEENVYFQQTHDREKLKDFLIKLLQEDDEVIDVFAKVLEEYREMR